MDDIKITAVFNTIQGEGRCAGEYVTFIRIYTVHCFPSFFKRNRCKFCDTVYNTTLYKPTIEIDDLHKFDISSHVVITGGEPLSLPFNKLYEFVLHLKTHFGVTQVDLETNGSFLSSRIEDVDSDYFSDFMNLFNMVSISPKLMNSFAIEKETAIPLVSYDYEFLNYIHLHWKSKVDFKFVVGPDKNDKNVISKDDIEEVKEFIKHSGVGNSNVYLMPITPSSIEFKACVADTAIQNKWNYSPRIHIDLWGPNTKIER